MRLKGRILFVDDDNYVHDVYGGMLMREGFLVDKAMDLREMKDALQSATYDLVFLDLSLSSESGLDGLPYLLKEAPWTTVVMLTASGTIENAVESLRRGAHSFLEKGVGPQKIVEEVNKFLQEVRQKPKELPGQFSELIGSSPSLHLLLARIERMGNADSPVLIQGESGTGKEIIARIVHETSNRKSGPFHAINCGAIPENLLESELFGHVKGAFTDAKADREGIFEICSKGTLLLDEVGDMPLVLQTKLLRVLQEKEVRPVGSNQTRKVNTRIVAATHRDLSEEVASGRFREDLYFRLGVIVLNVPPLRQRIGDITELANHFVLTFNKRFNRNVNLPSHGLLERMKAHDWPGNIRELQNAIERAVVLSPDHEIHEDDLFQHVLGNRKRIEAGAQGTSLSLQSLVQLPMSEAKHGFEREYLHHILTRTRGNITESARLSGRYRADLYRMFERYQIDPEKYRNLEKE